jgi:hypothetical protein
MQDRGLRLWLPDFVETTPGRRPPNQDAGLKKWIPVSSGMTDKKKMRLAVDECFEVFGKKL